ncbi:MAG TPA: SDR family oxidoreductase [Steroidobacteraceae bacterium]|jgi:2-keto-3-deoxy-L-fuconate dehydrogenase|nr:SDR family oxidoreductase [Steroidobacteraceae bacterium]
MQTQRLAGKSALVTAAAQGIGRATAELFAAHGANVLATDVNTAALAQLPQCRTTKLDVLLPDEIRRVVAGAGEIDILFNCAGFVANGSLLDCTVDQWALSFDLNVTSMFHLIRAVLPQMLERRRGSIINMASVASSIKGVVNRCAYSATKGAVIGLTKSIAADFVTSGVRCNAICPGTVDTPSLHQRLAASGDYDASLRTFIARQPMGRLGQPAEIAALALYLASDESQFTTGQCHIVDGGWSN